MPMYHYTSRLGAQDILGSGVIRPGRNGLLYLTDIRFSRGASAASQLSIVGKPVELGADLSDTEESSAPPARPLWSLYAMAKEGSCAPAAAASSQSNAPSRRRPCRGLHWTSHDIRLPARTRQ